MMKRQPGRKQADREATPCDFPFKKPALVGQSRGRAKQMQAVGHPLSDADYPKAKGAHLAELHVNPPLQTWAKIVVEIKMSKAVNIRAQGGKNTYITI